MSGIAFIIKQSIATTGRLGTVTLIEDNQLEGITIRGNSRYSSAHFTLVAEYNPATVIYQYKGVTWEIVEGGIYASISSEGVVTINSNANGNDIIVKATSVYDSTIIDQKVINVTYYMPLSISISGENSITDTSVYTATVYYEEEETSDENYTNVRWEVDGGAEIVESDGLQVSIRPLSSAYHSDVTIRCISNYDSSIIATKTITATHEPEWRLSVSEKTVSGSTGTFNFQPFASGLKSTTILLDVTITAINNTSTGTRIIESETGSGSTWYGIYTRLMNTGFRVGLYDSTKFTTSSIKSTNTLPLRLKVVIQYDKTTNSETVKIKSGSNVEPLVSTFVPNQVSAYGSVTSTVKLTYAKSYPFTGTIHTLKWSNSVEASPIINNFLNDWQ